MPERDVSWNIMVIGYAQNEKCNEALAMYAGLRRASIGVNSFSFAGVLVFYCIHEIEGCGAGETSSPSDFGCWF